MTRINFSPEELAARNPNLFGGLANEATPEEIAAEDRRQEAIAAARAKAEREREAEAFLASRGERYRHCRLSTFQCKHQAQRDALRRLREYLGRLAEEVDAGNGLIFYGPSGTGKDHLAVASAYAAIHHYGFSVAWKNGVELYSEFREAIDGKRSERDVITQLVRSKILVLSDPLPPKGALTEYQTGMLYMILEQRYSRRTPTWATINVINGDEAGQRMGVACYDRLRHGALAMFCNWPSYRRVQT